MNNEITLSFTTGQLFAIVGVICIIILTIYVVKLLKSFSLAAQEARELISKTHETLDDVREATHNTIEGITDRFGKLKTVFKFANKFKTKKVKEVE